MPSVVVSSLKEKAVYWPRLIPDGFPNGGITLPPVEIDCRWVNAVDTREQQIESTIMVDRELDTGGFIRLGVIDDLTPANATAYPPTTPTILNNSIAYWRFDGNILGDPLATSPDFTLNAGTVLYAQGAVASAVFNSNIDIDLSTASLVQWGGAGTTDVATVSMFVKLNEALAGDQVSVTFDFGGFTLLVEGNKISCLGSEWALPQGWASAIFRSVIIVLKGGELPILYVGGAEIARTVDGAAFVDIGNEPVLIATSLDDGNGFGSFGLDELRCYRAALSGREAQLLACVHPNLFDDAEEIIRNKAAYSLNKRLRVRKIWLSRSRE